MHTAILVIWIVGLVGAVPATLTILKLASLIVYSLLDIARLGLHTRDAAHGIAVNVATIPNWPDLTKPVNDIAAGARRIAGSARSIRTAATTI